MLVGVAALAVPIAIHLIGRQRARVLKFAALDFLLSTKRRTARRFRLRERLLLLVRAVACAAVAIALAKPYTSCARKGPQVTRGPQAAVLVIDDSFAAGYVIDGRPWLKTATDEARRILTQLGPEAEIAIVRASEGADHPSELTRDHIRLRDQLLALEPSARPADTTPPLAPPPPPLAASGPARPQRPRRAAAGSLGPRAQVRVSDLAARAHGPAPRGPAVGQGRSGPGH